MSLTRKTILITLGVMVPLFLAIILVSEIVVYRSFGSLEKADVEKNLLRAEDAIDVKIHNLESFTQDWSGWDDTYYYALGSNPGFIANNMMDYTFTTNQVNLMMIYDTSSNLLFSKEYDFVNSSEMTIPIELMDGLAQQKVLDNTLQGNTVSGFILTPDYPLLIVSEPVLNSFGNGPVAGVFVTGIIVDSNLVSNVSETTHLSLAVFRLDDRILPEGFQIYIKSDPALASNYVQPFGKNRVAGYHIVQDISATPILALRVDLPRDIYNQANTTILILHSLLFLLGAAFTVIFILILKRMITSRVIVLDQTVQDIGKTADRSKRVPVSGNDELSRLSSNINTMLASLEQADQKITSLYEQEKKHSDELEEEAKARSQFINVLAHELRTPLTPMLVSVEMVRDLLSSASDTIQYKLINTALSSANALRTRLEELLDLARFARGAFTLNKEIFDTGPFFDQVCSRYKPALDKRNQKLVVEIQPGLPRINADPSRVEQVIINLLSNASKYSPENSTITLAASLNMGDLLTEIRDQGIGIPADEQNNLFMPYHRAQQDRQSYPGIGLGLAVCSQIIQAHGGKIWVESERGKGSTFKFTLPLN